MPATAPVSATRHASVPDGDGGGAGDGGDSNGVRSRHGSSSDRQGRRPCTGGAEGRKSAEYSRKHGAVSSRRTATLALQEMKQFERSHAITLDYDVQLSEALMAVKPGLGAGNTPSRRFQKQQNLAESKAAREAGAAAATKGRPEDDSDNVDR